MGVDCLSLGVPGEGFHTHVGGVAILDVLGTVAVAGFLTKTTCEFGVVLVILFILSILAHLYFEVPTKVTTALFPNMGFPDRCLTQEK